MVEHSSHPDSPNYANHWTQDEVIEHFAPSTETVDAIRQWLNEFGIASHRILHTDNVRAPLVYDHRS